MSLNKTLDRLFDEIRREAKRNPDFANRLDAVLQLHDSRRDVPDEVVADVSSPASGGSGAGEARDEGGKRRRPSSGGQPAVAPNAPQPPEPVAPSIGLSPSINPAGLYKKEGEDALRSLLEAQELNALRALVAEHNLDPSGVTPALTRDELAAHIIDQAKKRAERDDKMFDY